MGTEQTTKTVVLAGPSRWRRSFLPNDVRVGWRIICGDGSPYDTFFGSALPERVDALLKEISALYGCVTVVDLRERPDDVRDRLWYDATHSAAASVPVQGEPNG